MAENPLTIPCSSAPSDRMVITRMPSGKFEFNNFDGRNDALVCLDEDTARQLFNWLGIWLHKGGS